MPPTDPQAPPSDNESWGEVRSILESALDLPMDERRAFVEETAANAAVRKRVTEMLEFEERAEGHGEGHGEGQNAQPRGDPFQSPLASDAEPSGPEGTPERIGPWELRRRIGRGGMADVWLAVRADGKYRRRVAIKKLHPAIQSDEVLARFERERQILANLSHPGISKLLEAGEASDGTPYIVMELVDGQRIDRFADERRLGVRARVQLIVQVADAVMAAHRMHVVHRDLKPSNVLIDMEGRPTLLDFGIAKVLDPEKESGDIVTRDTNRFLTPNYASPEQLLGEPLHAPSDVYSLAALTYELLTAAPALDLAGRGTADAITMASHRTPRPLATALLEVDDPEAAATARGAPSAAQLASELRDRGLGAVIMAGLRKEPPRRPPDAGAFRDELVRWLEGRAVQSAPDTWLQQGRRIVRRHRLASALIASLFVVSAAGSARVWMDARALEATNAKLVEQTTIAKRQRDALRESVTALLEDTMETLGGIPGTQLAVERLTGTGIRLAVSQNDPKLSMPLGLAIVRSAQQAMATRGPSRTLIDQALNGIALAQRAADTMGEDQRPRLITARMLLVSQLRATGCYAEARQQVDLAAADAKAMVPRSLTNRGDRACMLGNIQWHRTNIALSTGQFEDAIEEARAGLDLVASARLRDPALSNDDTILVSAHHPPVPEEKARLVFTRQHLLNVEANLMRCLLLAGAPPRPTGAVMDREVTPEENAHASNGMRSPHGANVGLSTVGSRVDAQTVDLLLARGQYARAAETLSVAEQRIAPIEDGRQHAFTLLISHAGLAKAKAVLLLAEPTRPGRDAELDLLSRRLSDLSVRYESNMTPSFQQRGEIATLLFHAGKVEAARGRHVEAASRLTRAYSLFEQNCLEVAESIDAAINRCRTAALAASLLKDTISEDEGQLWRSRAREHYDSMPWDDRAREQHPSLYEQVFSSD